MICCFWICWHVCVCGTHRAISTNEQCRYYIYLYNHVAAHDQVGLLKVLDALYTKGWITIIFNQTGVDTSKCNWKLTPDTHNRRPPPILQSTLLKIWVDAQFIHRPEGRAGPVVELRAAGRLRLRSAGGGAPTAGTPPTPTRAGGGAGRQTCRRGRRSAHPSPR